MMLSDDPSVPLVIISELGEHQGPVSVTLLRVVV